MCCSNAAGIYTPRVQFISLFNSFGVDERHAQELSDSFVLSDLERGGTFSRLKLILKKGPGQRLV